MASLSVPVLSFCPDFPGWRATPCKMKGRALKLWTGNAVAYLRLDFWCSVVRTRKIRTLRAADDERLSWKVSEWGKDSTGTGLSEWNLGLTGTTNACQLSMQTRLQLFLLLPLPTQLCAWCLIITDWYIEFFLIIPGFILKTSISYTAIIEIHRLWVPW